MTEQLIFNEQQLDNYYQQLKKQVKEGPIKITVKSGKQRSNLQNKSLHLYCKHLAEALNDAGYDCFNFFNEGFAMPWNEKLVKEMIWRPVQEAVIDKQSTAEANTTEYTDIYNVINRHLIENRNVFVQWPCKESLMYGQ